MNECEHIASLRRFLEDAKMSIDSLVSGDGWVRVHCRKCSKTFKVKL